MNELLQILLEEREKAIQKLLNTYRGMNNEHIK